MSTVISRQDTSISLASVAWAGFALLCLFYAVLAFDYFLGFTSGREGLWVQLMGALVSREFALGAGSAHLDQHVAYSESLRFMLMHTMMGAVCLAVAPLQFWGGFRRRHPKAHRSLGKLYLVSVSLSMFGGIGYLLATPMHEVYSGRPFAFALWALDISVLFTAWRAYVAARERDFLRHQAWMAYNFGLVLTTPMLRLLWVALGNALPGFNQAQVNLGITTFLLPLCLVCALIWLGQRRPA